MKGYNVATLWYRSHEAKEPTMLTADIRCRVEPELKEEATAILKASGLDVSTAIRLFLRSVVENGALPIELPRANPATLAAIRDAKAGRTTRTSLADF
jgi:DNA-damage-inducible protein J